MISPPTPVQWKILLLRREILRSQAGKKDLLWSQIEIKIFTLNFLNIRSTKTLQVWTPQPQLSSTNSVTEQSERTDLGLSSHWIITKVMKNDTICLFQNTFAYSENGFNLTYTTSIQRAQVTWGKILANHFASKHTPRSLTHPCTSGKREKKASIVLAHQLQAMGIDYPASAGGLD